MAGHRAALAGYLAALIRAKREEPGDDLLSALVRARDEHGALSEQELVLLAATLLVAGHETTVGLIGTAAFTLLRAPGGLTALPTDPDGLDAAVEELLRVNPIGDGGPLRVTLEEVEVAGTVIPANSAVIAAICSASHDETAYPGPDPAAYAPGRPGPAHLAFGHGPHYCLGAPLARAELRVALSELARRFPGMRLAVPPGEVRMRTGLIVNRLEELPVTW
jgi:nocardicin N-oxygenase